MKPYKLLLMMNAVMLWALVCNSCAAGRELRFVSAKEISSMVDLSELTPTEQKRLENVANAEVSPCGDDVSLALSLYNQKKCPLAASAAEFVVEMVKEDYIEHEISEAYVARFAAIKGMAIPVDGSPVIGAEEPQVTLVVFTDFQCPFCARAAAKIHELLKQYPEELAVVYKHLPLVALHPMAEEAARSAYAAGVQGKFWEMHDTLFSATGSELTGERIRIMAEGLGLDMSQFDEDQRSPGATSAIDADRRLAERLKINGTPAIFINGRELSSGLRSIDSSISEELLRAQSPRNAN